MSAFLQQHVPRKTSRMAWDMSVTVTAVMKAMVSPRAPTLTNAQIIATLAPMTRTAQTGRAATSVFVTQVFLDLTTTALMTMNVNWARMTVAQMQHAQILWDHIHADAIRGIWVMATRVCGLFVEHIHVIQPQPVYLKETPIAAFVTMVTLEMGTHVRLTSVMKGGMSRAANA